MHVSHFVLSTISSIFSVCAAPSHCDSRTGLMESQPKWGKRNLRGTGDKIVFGSLIPATPPPQRPTPPTQLPHPPTDLATIATWQLHLPPTPVSLMCKSENGRTHHSHSGNCDEPSMLFSSRPGFPPSWHSQPSRHPDPLWPSSQCVPHCLALYSTLCACSR